MSQTENNQPAFENILERLEAELDPYDNLNNDLARAINRIELSDEPETTIEDRTATSGGIIGRLEMHIETLAILNSKFSMNIRKLSELV